MERLGTDFNATGSVMSGEELENQRKKRGECVTCGRKCFQKKYLRMIPITDHGRVLNGRCLNCKPLSTQDKDVVIPASSRPATREDLARFTKSQSLLNVHAQSSSHSVSAPDRTASGASGGSHRRLDVSRPNLIGSRPMSSMSLGNTPISGSVPTPSQPLSAPVSSGSVDSVLSAVSAPPSLSAHLNAAAVAPHHGRSRSSRGEDFRMIQPPSATQTRLSASPEVAGSHFQPGGSERSVRSDSSYPSTRDVRGSAAYSSNGSHVRRDSSRERTYEDYDAYDSSPVSNEQEFQEAHSGRPILNRMDNRMQDEQDAYALASTHPAGAALIDYYNRFQDPGHGNLQSSSQHQGQEEGLYSSSAHGRRLNRGGAVRYAGSLSGGSSGSSRQNRSVGSDRYVRESERSLESMHSFDDDRDVVVPQCRPIPSSAVVSPPVHMVDPRIDSHLARLAAEEISSPPVRYTPPEDSINVSQHSHRSQQSHRSHQSSHISQQGSQQESRHSGSNSQQGGLMDSGLDTTNSSSLSNHVENNSSSMLSITRDNAGVERIRAAGGDFTEIVNVMLDIPDSTAVQSVGMQELSTLQLSRSDSDAFMQIGAHQVIINGMKAFPMDVDLQISGCRAIWNASGTSSNQVIFVEAGAIDVILFAMGHYLDDADVQEQAMATLANLAAVEVNAQVMVERGVVGAIVDGMSKHGDNVHVQAKGCAIVTNMASHSTPLKRSIMESGVGGAVVMAMVMHPSDPELQEKALRALRNLSANCDENKVELAKIGGIDSVISAMQVHRDESGVQESGAWTLSNLAGHPDNKVLIGDYGGIDVTVRAMWVHSDNTRVQEWCCRALFTLSLDRQNSRLIQDVGGISAIVNAMQAHVDTSVIQEMGCAVLGNLAQDTQSKMRIVDEEALDAIVLAMVLHGEDANVQERGVQVLLQLSIIENCKAMQASNISELAAAAAERFPEQCGEIADHLLQIFDNYVAAYNNSNA